MRPEAWQGAQTSSEIVRAEVPFSARIWWSLWQPVQVGASSEPPSTAWPCALASQSRASLSWHWPQVAACRVR